MTLVAASDAAANPVRPASPRLFTIALLAAAVGAAAGVAAWGLYALITLISNLVFFGHASLAHRDANDHFLGAWVLVVPAIGGLIVGLMAKYGSDKIRGHGIPEAMEAVLFNRSRI